MTNAADERAGGYGGSDPSAVPDPAASSAPADAGATSTDASATSGDATAGALTGDPDATLEAPTTPAAGSASTDAATTESTSSAAPTGDPTAAGLDGTLDAPIDAESTEAPDAESASTTAPSPDAAATSAPAAEASPAAAPTDSAASGTPAADASPSPAPTDAAATTPATGAPAAGGALKSERIQLVGESGNPVTVGVRTPIGKHMVRQFGDDASVWDAEQFTLERGEDGAWRIVPSAGTTNETLLNGEPITDARPLNDGDVIAVGRAAKGIAKLPLTARPA